MRQFSSSEKIFDKLIEILWWVSGILLFFITFSVCADVILRNTTRFSLDWVVETNEYALFLITYLGAAWCLKTDGHIRVDYIFNMLAPRRQLLVEVICCVLGGVTSLIFSYYAAYATWLSIERQTHLLKFLKVPKYYFSLVMFICTLLLLVVFVKKGLYYGHLWRESHSSGMKKTEGTL